MEIKHTTPDTHKRSSRRWQQIAVAAAATLATLLFNQAAAAAEPTTEPTGPLVMADTGPGQTAMALSVLDLTVGKSQILNARVPVKRLNVASPDVADVNPIGPQSVLVTAKKAGTTQVIIWDDNDHSQVIDVNVSFNVRELTAQLKKLVPGSNIEINTGGGAIALSGRVSNLEDAKKAMDIAGNYATKVQNFLEVSGGQQVMLQVRFAEVSRSASSQLGVNFGFTDGRGLGASNVGQINPFGLDATGNLTAPSPGAAVTVFGKGVFGNTALEAFVSALRQNNLLRTLADPNLTAMSGQEASFLAGGEFPIPVAQSGSGAGASSAITVEYKEFGIRLHFTPVVLGDGKIRLKVTPEVSDLDFSSPVSVSGFVMPIINKRTVTTTIELYEGQTFAIAGLLNSNTAATKDMTPGLGDLPFLGALFRSVRYQRKETELLVLVTPRTVSAMNPGQLPAVPGEKWRNPSENELFWEGDLGGPVGKARTAAAAATQPVAEVANAGSAKVNKIEAASAPAPRFQGPFGFQPVAQTTEVGE
jgi:pilus assembly protein CpaC